MKMWRCHSPIAMIAPFDGQIEWFLSMFGLYEFLPSSKFMEFLGLTACHENSPIRLVCDNILFLIAGYNFDQLEPELVPTILGHVPAGSSVRNLVHYAQGVNSAKFRKFDHGRKGNLEMYGQPTPPEYDVSKITAPVAFYWGENDWLGARADVYRLAEQLPNLQLMYRVNHDRYNHFDFIWAKDNNDLINRKVIDFMKHF